MEREREGGGGYIHIFLKYTRKRHLGTTLRKIGFKENTGNYVYNLGVIKNMEIVEEGCK